MGHHSRTNTCITEVAEKRKKEEDSLFEEIMAKHFPNLWKETDMQIHEVQRIDLCLYIISNREIKIEKYETNK